MKTINNEEIKVPRFLTIRQTAATGILPEHVLRKMEKKGLLPGFKTGKKFVINYDKLVEVVNDGGFSV